MDNHSQNLSGSSKGESFLAVGYGLQEGTGAPHPRGLPGRREDPNEEAGGQELTARREAAQSQQLRPVLGERR